MTTFVLAGGCFWCVDAALRQLRGVTRTECVYTGGTVPHPTYEQVCAGGTGHQEALRVDFDQEVLPADVLLDAYFTLHDPTTLDRQGEDVGVQYRSVMFYADAEQRALFEAARRRAQGWYDSPIVTRLEPLGPVYPAEEYHQNYFAKNPDTGYCRLVVAGKAASVRRRFADWMRAVGD